MSGKHSSRGKNILGSAEGKFIDGHPVLGEVLEYRSIEKEDSEVTEHFEAKIQELEDELYGRNIRSGEKLRDTWRLTKKRLAMLFDLSELYRGMELDMLMGEPVELSYYAKLLLIEAAVNVLGEQTWEEAIKKFGQLLGRDDKLVTLLRELAATARLSTHAAATTKIGSVAISDFASGRGAPNERFWALVTSIGGRYAANLELLTDANREMFSLDLARGDVAASRQYFSHLGKYKVNEAMLMMSAPYFLQDEQVASDKIYKELNGVIDGLIQTIYGEDRQPSYDLAEMDSLCKEVALVLQNIYGSVRGTAAEMRQILTNPRSRKKFNYAKELFNSLEGQGFEALLVGMFALDLRDIDTIMDFKLRITLALKNAKREDQQLFLRKLGDTLDKYLAVFANEDVFLTVAEIHENIMAEPPNVDSELVLKGETPTVADLHRLKNQILNYANLDFFEIDLEQVHYGVLKKPSSLNFFYDSNNPHHLGIELVWEREDGETKSLFMDVDIKRDAIAWSVLNRLPDEFPELRDAVLRIMKDVLLQNLERAKAIKQARIQEKVRHQGVQGAGKHLKKTRTPLESSGHEHGLTSKKRRRIVVVESPRKLDLLSTVETEEKEFQQVVDFSEDEVRSLMRESKVREDMLQQILRSLERFNGGNTRHFKTIKPEKPKMQALADKHDVDKLYVLRVGRNYRIIMIAVDSSEFSDDKQHFSIVRIDNRSKVYDK